MIFFPPLSPQKLCTQLSERENFLVGPFSSKQQDMKNEFYSLVSDDWIGDGDGINNLEATARAAADVGFELLASATVRSELEITKRAKGMRRTEHAVLLQAPG